MLPASPINNKDRASDSAAPGGPDARPNQEEALSQVERILASASFKGSKRCSVFLRYVSQLAFQDHHEPLKERILGIEIFGRPPGYDTNEDPVVRNAAGEVRKRLAQYYQKPGHESEIRVELPVGSYLPRFTLAPPAVEAPAKWKLPPALRWKVALAALATLGLAAVLLWPQSALEAFWAPVMKTPGSVLVCIGQPVAFNFTGSLEARMDKIVNSPTWFAEHGNDSVAVRDILPFRTRYVTLLDAIALSRITGVLNANSKPFRIRGLGSTSFSDLRDNSTVLIGAFTNDWTLRVDDKARFYFFRDAATGEEGIRDRQNPARREWSIVRPWPEWNIGEDYALVSRIFGQDTGRVVVTAAGITQFGTSAAGEFVTNTAYLQQALGQIPDGWKKQNLQVVLATKVVDQVAGPPRVLAVYSW